MNPILVDEDIDVGKSAIITHNAKVLGTGIDADESGEILTVSVHFLDGVEQKAITMQRDDALILLLMLKHALLDSDIETRPAN